MKEEELLKERILFQTIAPLNMKTVTQSFQQFFTLNSRTKKSIFLTLPGLDDFSGGVISSLYAVDSAVMTINVQNGVEVGTEIHFRHAEKVNKPLILVVNGLDHEKANFEKSLEMMKERLSNNVVLIQYPVNEGVGFNSIIDVLKMKMLRYGKDGGKAEDS